MSRYTTELRYICESLAGLEKSEGYAKTGDVIKQAIPKLFDFSYPIFDSNYKNVLENKIVRHFYTREIGMETYGLWKFRLETKLNEIMPYYNQLYRSELIKFEPLINTDYTTTNSKEYSRTQDSIGNNTETANFTSNKTANTHSQNNDKLKQDTTTNNATDFGKQNTTTSDGNNNQNYHIDRSTKYNNLSEKQGTNVSTTESGTFTVTTQNKHSDTPQGSLENFESNKYLSSLDETSVKTDYDKGNDRKTIVSGAPDANEKITNGSVQELDGDGSGQDETFHTENISKDSGTETNKGNTNFITDDLHTSEQHAGEKLSSENSVVNNSKDNTTISDTESYVNHVSGKTGSDSYSKMLLEFRNTFLNIDMLIIGELEELFMQIW